jgi:threonine/homoserine efflux transporter RhtA
MNINDSRSDLDSEKNPYSSNPIGSVRPIETDKSKKSSLYAHVVALLGAALVFAGATLAVFVIPTAASQHIASSRIMVQTVLVLAVICGLVAGSLSYRSTLRVYSKKQ